MNLGPKNQGEGLNLSGAAPPRIADRPAQGKEVRMARLLEATLLIYTKSISKSRGRYGRNAQEADRENKSKEEAEKASAQPYAVDVEQRGHAKTSKGRAIRSTEQTFSTSPREHFPSFPLQPQGPQVITLRSVVLGTAQALGGERITLRSVVLDKEA